MGLPLESCLVWCTVHLGFTVLGMARRGDLEDQGNSQATLDSTYDPVIAMLGIWGKLVRTTGYTEV